MSTVNQDTYIFNYIKNTYTSQKQILVTNITGETKWVNRKTINYSTKAENTNNLETISSLFSSSLLAWKLTYISGIQIWV